MIFYRETPLSLNKKLRKFLDGKIVEQDPLTDEELQLRDFCEESFYNFAKTAWSFVEGREYKDGWYVQVISEHLEALYNLDIRYLILNAPPRMGKSTLMSVLFPAWVWIQNPNLSFLYTAYGKHLSLRDSLACRSLIMSEWYQRLWHHKFSLIVKGGDNFSNDKQGFRRSSSVSGGSTGHGGDFRVCDDSNDVRKVHSIGIRERTNMWWDLVFSSRFREAATSRTLLGAQRTHMDDLTGHILSQENPEVVHLCLPLEFESWNTCKTIILPSTNGKIWTDPRTKDGELLCEAVMPPSEIDSLKRRFLFDSYTISSQLQQRPAPEGGGLIKKDWFKKWEHPYMPPFEFILQSWDTALTTSKDSCYSACTTWGIFDDGTGAKNVMLLSLFRHKVEYPDLRKIAKRLALNYDDIYMDDDPLPPNKPVNLVLIEQKVSGYSLVQDLKRQNIPIKAFDPGKYGCKIGRCRTASHLMENGLVWLPTEGKRNKHLTQEAQMFLEAAENFPRGDSNDIIDSMSQAFIRLTQSGWVYNTEDPSVVNYKPWEKDNKPFS